MPIIYLCRKCGKSYSKQEFTESKFCQSCGSFLLPSFEVRDQGLISFGKNLSKKGFSPKMCVAKSDNSFKERNALIRAADSLRQKITSSKEYEIVPETKDKEEQPKVHLVESWIWSSEYDEALKLERELIKQYKGKDLEHALSGKVVSNE